MHPWFWSAAWLCAAGAAAAQEVRADNAFDAPPVSDSRLAAVRGGWDAGNGLLLSLGVERLVSINGTTVASSAFQVSDVTKLNASQAQSLSDAAAALNLVQSGPANVFQPGALGATLGGVVIQNSANGQLIQSQTTINAAVNSASLLKALNFGSSMRDALSYAAGQH